MKIIELSPGEEFIPSVLHMWPEGLGYSTSLVPPEGRDHVLAMSRIKMEALGNRRSRETMRSFPGIDAPRYVTGLQLMEELATEVVREVRRAVPNAESLRLSFPAAKKGARDEYRELLERIARKLGPGRRHPVLVFEPDAVLQYFRLVKRSFQPKRGRLEAYLVIDSGAGTTNMSVVFKPKSLLTTEARVGIARPLRPVSFEAPYLAGNDVNVMLMDLLLEQVRSRGVSRMDVPDAVLKRQIEDRIEAVKIEASRGGRQVPVALAQVPRSAWPRVDREMLEGAARDLWASLRKPLFALFAETLDRLQSYHHYSPLLEERGIDTVEAFPRLFDHVFLAGGNSLLPGFASQLSSLVPVPPDRIHRVKDDDYRVAVAAGMAAQALELLAEAPVEKEGERTEAALPPAAEPAADEASTEPVGAPDEHRPWWRLPRTLAETKGIARLETDVALIWRKQGNKSGWKRMVFDSDVPLEEYEANDGRVLPDFKQRIQQSKRPKHFEFALARGVTEGLTPMVDDTDTENLWLLGEASSSYWKLVRAQDCPKRFRAVGEYMDSPPSIRVSVYDAEQGEDSLPITQLTSFLFDSNEERERVRNQLLKFEERLEVAKELFAQAESTASSGRRAPEEDEVPKTVSDSRLVNDAPYEIGIDIGTSKIIVVQASPPFELERRLDDEEKKRREEEAEQRRREEEAEQKRREEEAEQKRREEEAEQKRREELAEQKHREEEAEQRHRHGPQPLPQESRWTEAVDMMEPPEWPVPPLTDVVDEAAFVKERFDALKKSGLSIELETVLSLHLALKTGPMVALGGPPGVGKSTLSRLWARLMGASPERGSLARIAVEACWTDSSFLMGGCDQGAFAPTPFTKLLARSEAREDELFFAVLDEWNLAHVDYYLSQILSYSSAQGALPLMLSPGVLPASLQIPLHAPEHRVFLLGTMNIDDAGTLLTDKVLDRTAVIELPLVEPPALLTNRVGLQGDALPALSAQAWHGLCALPSEIEVPEIVRDLWRALAGAQNGGAVDPRFTFSYRVARSIAVTLCHARALGTLLDDETRSLEEWVVDGQICQRILPRLRGGLELKPVLERLSVFCQNRHLTKSRARIDRMLQPFADNDMATSFWTS